MGRWYLPKLAIVRGLLDTPIIILSSCGSISFDWGIVKSFAAFDYIAENIKKYPEDCLSTVMILAYHLPNSFPTISLIAEMTGRSTRTIMRKIKKLEDLELITVTRRHRNSSIYTLNLGDTALSRKKVLGDKTGVVRVTNSTSLGDNMVSLQHTSNKQVKEEYFLNKNDEDAINDRKNFIKELLSKKI